MFSLTGQFLVAMPGMVDPVFSKKVIYICLHNENGAMGLVINKIIPEFTFKDLASQLKLLDLPEKKDINILSGGPMDPTRGFVLHTPEYKSKGTLAIDSNYSFSFTTGVIQDIAYNKGPEKYLIILGYTGWGKGQLEQELKSNSWLPIPATTDILFDQPLDCKWAAALNSQGISPYLVSNTQSEV